MANDFEFTGERFVPGAAFGEIVYEHVHRYAFARRFARGRRVLDAACGEGYGSGLLAEVAQSVVGVDVDAESIAHASSHYRRPASLRFVHGSVTALPLADASVDLVVSFETIEHLSAADQARMLGEFARVLNSEGLLLLSSPNRPEYSEARGYRNPFHVHELDRAGLTGLLDAGFPARRWYRQRLWLGSTVWAEQGDAGHEVWNGDPDHVASASAPEAMYFLVLAARGPQALPPAVSLSLFADEAETELKRAAAHASEAMRLDKLATEQGAALDRQTLHIQHLERLVVERERLIVQRDSELSAFDATLASLHERNRELAAVETRLATRELDLDAARRAHHAQGAECERLERALAAQERLLSYLQSFRGWIGLPWRRAKLWIHRLRGA